MLNVRAIFLRLFLPAISVIATGCNPLVSESKIDANFSPGLSATAAVEVSPYPKITGFQLGGGASPVAQPTLTVNISATAKAGLTDMQISESPTFAGATWVTYASSGTNFTVSLISGAKTVYARVRDAVGNISDPVTANLTLDYGSPPTVTVTSPVAGASYIAGNTVPIAWTCSSSNGLAAHPIASIKYTTDEGVTFVTPDIATDIDNNLTATTGSYNWTLPGGVTTFRLLVSCKSAAGVVASAYSQPLNTGGWSVYMGDASYRMNGVNALVADVRGRNILGDSDNNIYFTYGHAIKKIDAITGLVTIFAGSEAIGGCTFVGGVNPTGTGIYLTNPVLIGPADNTNSAFFVGSCGNIYKVSATGIVTNWAITPAISTSLFYGFLTKNKILLYFGTDNNLYKVDLSTSGGTATAIYGNGTCLHTGFRYTNGTDVFGQEMFQSSPTQSCTEGSIVANDDASTIWMGTYNSGDGMRLDYHSGSGHYRVGISDIGYFISNYRSCVIPNASTNKIYCSYRSGSPAGRGIHEFNTTTETWTTYAGTVPFTNNDNSGDMYLGLMKDKLVSLYTLNSIDTTDVTTTPFTYTHIAGTAYSIMGNGNDPAQVEFGVPRDIKYNSATQTLWVKNETGHMRKIDFSTNPVTTSTNFLAVNGWAGSGFSYLTINPAGNKFSFKYACNRNSYDNWSLAANVFTEVNWLMSNTCENITGLAYPPASGIDPIAAKPIFVAANAPYFSNSVMHSNGTTYFSGKNGANDVFIFSSNGVVMNRIAGKVGAGGYNAGDNGNLALGASLTNVHQMQEIASGSNAGDLLIWDGDRLRMITITTQSASPKIVDLYNMTLAAGFTTGTTFYDVFYDQGSEQGGVIGTGTIYYVSSSNGVRKIAPNAAMTTATQTAYTFTGTSFSGVVRITLTPAGLLVLQPNKNRILKVTP